MSLVFPQTDYVLASSAIFKHATAVPFRHQFRPCKRRRLRPFSICCHFNPSPFLFHNLFHTLLSQFPSVNHLNYIAPTLGLASGLALYFSSKPLKLLGNPENSSDFDPHIGEWIFFSSPTPFNRFVTLRCPSICFPGGELLENVKEKLVKEDIHYVTLNCGRIVQSKSEEDDEIVGKLVYQRLCVGTEDGGVLSLDWPVNLDLEEERGLDTTVLIVPGTAEGSKERKIKRFVCEALRRGVFPVVMNPRGCAGSPLTTPRLFTAADSDDIFTAVQFIHKKRSWTTFMGVGCGYGANMLTKYLAEYGDRTPLTAATCIDNPFDLQVATRSTLDDKELGQSLIGGLVNILQENKELFRGRGKGFDVEKALSAASTRDFDSAISMVSYGFDVLEDFYEKSSTLDVVGKVKIPVLFIQNDDGTLPMFSIPRGLIAENPYTSLLLCSYLSSGRNGGLNFSWCLNVTIEWLNAVELGLLKGRHPLLKDFDVTINPTKGLALLDGKSSVKSDSENKLLNSPDGYSSKKSPARMLDAYGTTAKFRSTSAEHIGKIPQTEGSQEEASGVKLQPSDAQVEEEASNSSENERGQALQTAQVVMNMLDATMPDILSEERKKKVLNAVGHGEMLMKALEDAVPEDVRGKLTSSVSEIVQSQSSNIKFDQLFQLGHIPNVASGLHTKLQEKIGLSLASGDENARSAGDGSSLVDHSAGKLYTDVEVENRPSEKLETSNDPGLSQSTGSHLDNNLTSGKDNQKGIEDNSDGELPLGHNLTENLDGNENLSGMSSANKELPDQNKGPGETQDTSSNLKEMERENVEGQPILREKNNDVTSDVSNDQSKEKRADHAEGNSAAPSSFPKTQTAQNEGENNQQKKEKDPQPVSSQITAAPAPAPPSFGVSQALDAITGFDDTAQVAVNSVFQAIEGMLDKLEVKKEDENQVKDEINKIDVSSRGASVNNLREGTLELKDPDQKSERVDVLWRKPGFPGFWATFPYGDPLYREYLRAYLLSEMRKAKPAVLDTNSALYLDYVPEDGQWKLLEQAEDGVSGEKFTARESGSRDSRKQQKETENFAEMNVASDHIYFGERKFDESIRFVKNLIVEFLNIEVERKVSASMEEFEPEIARDIEHVANAVSLAARHESRHMYVWSDHQPETLGYLQGENIIRAISFAIQDTQYLRQVLPVGVIVGSSLAALRKFFDVSALDSNGKTDMDHYQIEKSSSSSVPVGEKEIDDRLLEKVEDESNLYSPLRKAKDKIAFQGSNNNKAMLGAVTAALGASALLIGQQNTETDGTSMDSHEEEQNIEELSNLEEVPEKNPDNIVTSLAEKAMSVASPVVPTTEDGEVDHDRLVAMLAELGQKGGILRLVGKVALLWGGIRGAMSLTDKLISFLHIADRPLFQRILGFMFMVMLLWSPVVIPLFPSLLRSWTTKNQFKIVELTCIAGLYISITIMVTLWGKRIRKYDDPLRQYGLDFTSMPKLKNFLMGLAGGAILVLLIQSVNFSLGCVRFCWPTTLSSSYSEPVTLIKSYVLMLLLIVQGIATATGVATVEELLFRAWLPEEISSDIGYHRAIIISGFAFCLSQRSVWEIPGLWLLSLSLSGARQRSEGSLALPVGVRTGILACSFILKMGGFLTIQHKLPLWFSGGHTCQPFSGVVGLAFSLVLAVIMYPRQPPLYNTKSTRAIKD